MAGGPIQNTSQANPIPVNNGMGLPSGKNPSIIPLNIDLTVAQNVLVDLTQQQQSGRIGPIQTLFVNNSNNASSVTVVAGVSGIPLTFEAGQIAIVPFFLPNQAPKFNVISTGAVILSLAVLDTPQPALVWDTTNGSFTFQEVNGLESLNVVDTALQALISNIGGAGNALDVNVITGGGGGGGDPASFTIYSNILQSSGNIAFGPGAGKFWLITGYEVNLSNDAANGVGGSASVQLFEAASPFTTFATGIAYVPAAAPAIIPAGSQNIMRGFNPNGLFTFDNANNQPSFNWNGTALTQGHFAINLYGQAIT